jgi:hypothetical protein
MLNDAIVLSAVMLNVTNHPLMLDVVMLSVMTPFGLQFSADLLKHKAKYFMHKMLA